jgi:hypothetical protein
MSPKPPLVERAVVVWDAVDTSASNRKLFVSGYGWRKPSAGAVHENGRDSRHRAQNGDGTGLARATPAASQHRRSSRSTITTT